MKLGDGLFLNTCRRVAEEYKDSGITFSDMMCVPSPLISPHLGAAAVATLSTFRPFPVCKF
jgi:hypothetical protein